MPAGHFQYFDLAETDDDSGIRYRDDDSGTSNAFDVNGTGVCVDVRYDYLQGCPSQGIANFVDTMAGCVRRNPCPSALPCLPLLPARARSQADRFISQFMCGVPIHIQSGDPTTADYEEDAFAYPRVLQLGGEDLNGDGKVSEHVECDDPADCVHKYVSRAWCLTWLCRVGMERTSMRRARSSSSMLALMSWS